MTGRLLWLPAALTQAGLRVNVVGGWETRGRGTMHARAGVWHHTAAKRGANAPSLRVVIDGRSDLPGPLCHVLVGRDLTCHVIASGVANHAGAGGWQGLTGNSSVVGVECENDGVSEPWSDGMVDVMVRIAAACCQAGGFAPDRWCGHKEWAPTRKVDPRGLDCSALRRRVAALLAPPEDDDMQPPTLALLREKPGAGQLWHCYRIDGNVASWCPTNESIDACRFFGMPWWGGSQAKAELDPVIWSSLAVMNGPLANIRVGTAS